MKKLVLTLSLAISASAFSAGKVVEFDQNQEKNCHQEAKTLGCLNSSGEENPTCLEQKKAKLSKACQTLRTEKSLN